MYKTNVEKIMTTFEKIKKSLSVGKKTIFLRQDFEKFGKRSTVDNALGALVKKQILVKAGYGVYVKTKMGQFGRVPCATSLEVAKNVLDRLGVKYSPSKATLAYNRGESTQVPLNPALTIESKTFIRKIGFRKKVLLEKP